MEMRCRDDRAGHAKDDNGAGHVGDDGRAELLS